MRLSLRVLVLTGAAAVAGGAWAKEPPGDVYQGFKAETISAVFSELGATDVKTTMIENEPRVAFTLNKTFYVVDFYECEDAAKGCKAIHFMASYVAEPTDTVQAVNKYNATHAYGKAVIDNDGGLTSMHLVNGEFGSSKAHVLSEWKTFVDMTQLLFEELNKNVVAQAPGAGTATFLNSAAQASVVSRRSRLEPPPAKRRR